RAEVPISKLKAVTQVLDVEPVFSEPLFQLLRWASTYYHHPVGEVLHTALPVALRRGGNLRPTLPRHWFITSEGGCSRATLSERAVIQRQVLAELADAESIGVPEATLRSRNPRVLSALRRLEARGWVSSAFDDSTTVVQAHQTNDQHLTPAQSESSAQVVAQLGRYAAFLLHGVTGSGKTEVYLSIAREAIARNTQVLVLVPEIALTPQLVARFSQGLAGKLVVLHSGLSGPTRHRGWWAARQGLADVILGTRSAVFTPCLHPGLIIVDEEHDPSFKQQDGFRYHARDVAVKRAQIEKIPVVLGSATPSLETLENVRKGRYSRVLLPQRVGGAVMPDVKLVDIARTTLQNGLSTAVLDAIETRLNRGEQSIIYVNRRGFAPVVLCLKCRWKGQCLRCDAG
ncbi:MAG TPA: primosomal protein N', partial [Gammaproteobacteria bacterium]|nr:primosomal protein N' [Gammaproteobacteria bacterium]